MKERKMRGLKHNVKIKGGKVGLSKSIKIYEEEEERQGKGKQGQQVCVKARGKRIERERTGLQSNIVNT